MSTVAGINAGKIEMTGEVGEILSLVINSHYTLSSYCKANMMKSYTNMEFRKWLWLS